jgi:hypothetical protein
MWIDSKVNRLDIGKFNSSPSPCKVFASSHMGICSPRVMVGYGAFPSSGVVLEQFSLESRNPKDPVIDLANNSYPKYSQSWESQREGSSCSFSATLGCDPYLLHPRASIYGFPPSRGLGFVSAKDPWPSKESKKSALKHAQENYFREVI